MADTEELDINTSEVEESMIKEGEGGAEDQDAELEEMKRRVTQMEEEAQRLIELQSQVELGSSSGSIGSVNKEDTDSRSVYVGNVDYGATPEELQAHFQSCGTINRITILCDKFTGHPKGFAYVEFVDKESVANAMVLNESLFRGRQIKVTSKRTNVPFFMRGGFTPRGAGGAAAAGGGRRARGFSPYGAAPRGRFRSRRAFYHPYM